MRSADSPSSFLEQTECWWRLNTLPKLGANGVSDYAFFTTEQATKTWGSICAIDRNAFHVNASSLFSLRNESVFAPRIVTNPMS